MGYIIAWLLGVPISLFILIWILDGSVIYGFITWTMILFLSVIMMRPIQHYVTASTDALSNTTVITKSDSDTKKVALKTNSTNTKKKEAPAVEVNTNQLAWGGWLLFGLFFLEAFFSCVGACYSIRCKRVAEL